MKILIQITDESGKRSFSLKPTPLSIGRKPNNDIQVADALCSGTHCQIYFEAGSVYVEDLNSKNGTFLNGTKIKKAKFYINDHIEIGKSNITIDGEKLDKNTFDKLLTPKGSIGGVSLEIENPSEVRKRVLNKEIIGDTKSGKDYLQKSKLYEKIGDKSNEGDEDLNIDATMNKANRINSIFNIVVFSSPYLYLFLTSNSEFNKFISTFDLEIIFKSDLIFYFMGSVLGMLIFNKINKGLSSGSIGEKIVKK